MTTRALFRWLLAGVPRRRVAGLVALILLVGLTEGVGLLMLVPLIGWMDPASGVRTPIPGLDRAPAPGFLLVMFVLLVAARSALQQARQVTAARLRLQVMDSLRIDCFEAITRAEWRWVATVRHADVANVLVSEVARVGAGLDVGLALVAAVAMLVAGLGAAMLLSWRLTAIALASGSLVFLLLARHRRRALRLGQDLTETGRVLHGRIQQGLAGLKVARLLGAGERQAEAYREAVTDVSRRQARFVALGARAQALFQVAGAALLAGHVYIGWTVWHTPGPVLVTLVVVFARLVPLLVNGQQQLHQLLNALPAAAEVQRFLSEARRHAEPPGPVADLAFPLRDAIRLESVTVRHEGRSRPALDALDLHLPSRRTTLVMGASGAGKSTLADLLAGLIEPDAGRWSIDGVPVSGSDRLSWRRQVACVPQDVFLFHDTVRANLACARPGASEADLRDALQRAAAGFVLALPEGLDTVVGEAGVRLSGGERQRIALARALLQAPRLLVLDEATSALDADNEAAILQALDALRGELTIVVLGHRHTLARHADQVVVLEAGRLASLPAPAACLASTPHHDA